MTETTQPTPHQLANAYVSQGWPVFPCRSEAEDVVDRHTGEVTTLGEKTPLTIHGFKQATKFQHIIDRWWSDWPDAAIGLPTGSPTGFFALDIDNKPGGANGFAWLSDMEAEHGPLPVTARVISPNGGLHIYFKYVAGTRNRGALGAGVDIRSEGGYVVAAGSVLSNGRHYKWADDTREIADAPAWLLDLLLPKSAPSHTHYAASSTNVVYVDAAIERELSDLASEPMGNRNNALNDAAFSLGQWVGGGHLSESEARAQLQDVARGWGRDWSRCCKTIENGLKAGALQPRHPPEQDFHQDNTRLVDVQRMVANGLRKARVKTGLPERYDVAVEGENDPERDESAKPDAPETEDIPTGITDTAHEEPANDNSPLTATAFKWIDPKSIARREFAYGNHLIRKYVSVTVSPGGLGKTSLSLAEALAMTSGKTLLGTKPAERLRVWVFNAEDPRDEMERRIMAAAIHYKLKPEDIEGHLFLDSGREQELVVAVDDKKAGVRIQQPIVEAVVEQIERNKIDVMIVDPFVSTHSVNENDNGAIDKVAKLWAQIADYTNCAIDIVHHLRKVADREATVEDARGAVSLIGAARSVRVLNRMSPEQANEAGVDGADRFGYFSVTYGKSNLTPLSSKLDWRHLVGVPLGNGRGLTKPQDFAPVVTEWKWPSKEEIAEAVPPDVRKEVLVRFANQNYRESSQSEDWAGYVLASALGMHVETAKAMTADKRKVKAILDAWISSGILAVVDEPDPKHFDRKIKFVRPAEAA
ncbi:ATPase [Shinella sumterensis]|uniref:bifunctional DNA primase/polymerase n=1 Tax=Shinella sumterensis TaxID=1967501 RepID=UPI00106EF1F1|nr:bifunctional DNA primase/polymerase [Shinella sumterensis]MCD1264052.1 AAA family ATPase [Shinella sumterensis]TFE99413.1 ATPase [Shinella sumterensis]